jgi:Cu(I)/Ag(I) efflux system membrane fusion protein
MKSSKKHITPFIRLLFAASLMLLASCNKNHNHAEMAGADEYYTCSMDPQVVENKAGNCPVCHMKLIKVKKNNLKPGQIKLSAQQIKLGNITFDTLRVQEIAKEIILTGKVAIDQNLSEAISARVPGRIESLAVKNIGDYIRKGQLLYEIYSEDLNAAQAEYILALQKSSSTEDFSEAAKTKLSLYGMSETQINQLKISKQVLHSVPIYAASEGFVNEISVTEGSYVSTGTTLFRIASPHSLWIEAQAYLSYLSYLKIGTEAYVSIPAANEKSFSGRIIFIDPQVQSPARYVLIRFQIANPSQQIRPGMLASIVLQTEKKKSFALPVDAVTQDSNGANVWVRNSDGVFENRMVTTGMQNSQQIEIIEGLMAGNVVVVTGAYLLNSEYVFKKGANPMEGHKEMPGMKM